MTFRTEIQISTIKEKADVIVVVDAARCRGRANHWKERKIDVYRLGVLVKTQRQGRSHSSQLHLEHTTISKIHIHLRYSQPQ